MIAGLGKGNFSAQRYFKANNKLRYNKILRGLFCINRFKNPQFIIFAHITIFNEIYPPHCPGHL
jgi:hypothetical protein